MRHSSVVRNLVLVCLAVAVGWWLRGAGAPVHASSSSSSDADLAFQFVGAGPQQSLTLYSQQNHTLYVYPRVAEGNSHISCEYSFTISRPGAPMDRQNCPLGEQLPQR